MCIVHTVTREKQNGSFKEKSRVQPLCKLMLTYLKVRGRSILRRCKTNPLYTQKHTLSTQLPIFIPHKHYLQVLY